MSAEPSCPHPSGMRPALDLRRPCDRADAERCDDERSFEVADGRQRVDRRQRDDRLAFSRADEQRGPIVIEQVVDHRELVGERLEGLAHIITIT